MSHDSLLVPKAANMTFLRRRPDTFSIIQRARDYEAPSLSLQYNPCLAFARQPCLSLSSHGYRRTMWSKAAVAIDSMNAALSPPSHTKAIVGDR